jgi:radical SAM modification target selenobiotic family peptide
MDERQLKKLLAGLCITGLLSGACPACAQQGQSS